MKPSDILFKAKRMDNGEWVEGHYHSMSDEVSLYHCIKQPFAHCDDDYIPIDPATIGQYTTRKDKTGKMIFGGDTWLIDIDDGMPTTGYVEWIGDGWAVVHNDDEIGEYHVPLMEALEDIAITGSIHDRVPEHEEWERR